MNWQLVPQQLATGLLNGGIIAIIALGIVLIYPSNVLLAWAISILFIPLGYLIIKQTRSINLIERGLTERGYSLKPTN